jgi:hypothetical protein
MSAPFRLLACLFGHHFLMWFLSLGGFTVSGIILMSKIHVFGACN